MDIKDNYVLDNGEMTITAVKKLDDKYRYTISDGKYTDKHQYDDRAGFTFDSSLEFSVDDKVTLSKVENVQEP
jgi:hypothetical protein